MATAQEQMDADTAHVPSDTENEGDAVVTSAAAGSSGLSDPMAQMMMLLAQLIQGMPANIAAAVKVDRPSSHLDNVKLDIRNFSRIKTFTNKHDAWREWKNQFIYVIYECDNHFGDYLSGLEKGDAGRRRRRPEPYSGSALGDVLQPIAISHYWHRQRHGHVRKATVARRGDS